MRTTLFLSALVSLLSALASPARAELLIELTHKQNGTATGGSSPQPLEFNAFLGSPPYTSIKLGGTYDSDDVGTVVSATPQQLFVIQTALGPAGGSWESLVIGYGGTWNGEAENPPNRDITRHVPGEGLRVDGYTLTEVTQTIDLIQFVPHGGVTPNLVVPVAQDTIRFYGIATSIPEPNGAILALLLLLCVYCRARLSRRIS